jgi:ribulose 1,5-bisphosphate carboxylase large subunit-like protein
LEVYKRNYEHPKLQEYYLKNFGTPNLGILGQNDIWVLAPWPKIENTIKGKVVISPKFGP